MAEVMRAMTRHELITRLEAATEPDVSLDIAIHNFVCAQTHRSVITNRQGFPMDAKGYTHSIDAALSLVPEGFQGFVGICGNRVTGVWKNRQEPTIEAKHNVPAIALCIAALRAGDTKPENSGDDA